MAVITGWGAVSCLGHGVGALWRGLERGEDGISPIRRFSMAGFNVKIGALVPSTNREAAAGLRSADLCVAFALEAAREAYADARLGERAIPRDRVALVMGASPGAEDVRVFELTEKVADALEANGPRITVSTACTSSTNAI